MEHQSEIKVAKNIGGMTFEEILFVNVVRQPQIHWYDRPIH